MKSFSFFEIDLEYKDQLISKINNIKWRGVKLKIEEAKPRR